MKIIALKKMLRLVGENKGNMVAQLAISLNYLQGKDAGNGH